MKIEAIRKMSQTELAAEESKLKKELFNLRFQHVTGQLENPLKMKEVKKEYAGKAAKQKEYKVDFESRKYNPKSLFHEDDEDYVSPEEQAKMDEKLKESDPDSDAPKDEGGLITKATLKDDQKK